MGKQSSPAAPNYAPIAAADAQAATQQFQLGEQQQQFAQQQAATLDPYVTNYLNQETQTSALQTQQAEQAQQNYNTTYQPIETNFANTASNYNSPAQANVQAGNAMADVASSFDANRAASLSSLESYGIDPSQTRYQALDLGTRISQAAATAAAGTQSRLNTQATGLALQGEAVNMGEGIQNNVAQSYATATGAGTAGIGAFNQSTSTGSGANATAGNIYGGSATSNNFGAQALNLGYQNNLAGAQFQAQQSQAAWSGIGQLVGSAAGAAMMFA